MIVRARFFAAHRERTGTGRIEVELPDGATVAELAEQVVERYPDLGTVLRSARFAVNREYQQPGAVLHDGDEVAFIPPVAGGDGPHPRPLSIGDGEGRPIPPSPSPMERGRG